MLPVHIGQLDIRFENRCGKSHKTGTGKKKSRKLNLYQTVHPIKSVYYVYHIKPDSQTI